MSTLLLATEDGSLLACDLEADTVEQLFRNESKRGSMGLCRHGDHYYVASLNRVYKLETGSCRTVAMTEAYSPAPDFHQMQIYDGKLYTTATKRNAVWVYDLDLQLLDEHLIVPPIPERPVKYKENYNHLNNVIRHQGRFYVNLNWFTSTRYGCSGVVVLDQQFNELERFEYGWETHDFTFVDGRMAALCGSSNKAKKLNHVYKSGLMVDGELVFDHDPDHWFCKGLCWDEKHLYLCGGEKSTRLKRRSKKSVIFVLDRTDYRLIKEITDPRICSIKGAVLLDD